MGGLSVSNVVFNEQRNVSMACYVQERLDEPIGHIAVPVRRPAILIMPGGAYQYLADREALPVALPFLNAGYQAFVLNYSIAEFAVYPDPLIDASMAIRWIRAHAGVLNVHPQQIAVIGFSAGGHLAACLGTQWHMPHWKDEEQRQLTAFGDPALADASNRPDAMILAYAVTDTKTRAGSYSLPDPDAPDWPDLIEHIDDQAVPAFLWHTAEDTTVPAAQSLAMADRLLGLGIPVELHLYAHGPHGISVGNDLTDYGQAGHMPVNVTTWLPLAIAWLGDQLGYDRPGEQDITVHAS